MATNCGPLFKGPLPGSCWRGEWRTRWRGGKSADVALALLEEGADLAYRGSSGRTLLHLASARDAEQVILYLMNRNPSLVSAACGVFHRPSERGGIAARP